MNEQVMAIPGVPQALHRGYEELPWVSLVDGVSGWQLLSFGH